MTSHRTTTTRSVAPPAVAGRAGDLDPLVVAAVTAARPLTDSERASLKARHQPHAQNTGDVRTCRACAYRYPRAGATACPSATFAATGRLRATLDLLPATTSNRACRTCRTPVPVPAGTRGQPLCDACQDQNDLFGGTL